MAQLPVLKVGAPHIEKRIHRALEADREREAEKHRGRLALGSIGKCVRDLWAGVREIPEDKPTDGRALVIFEHGHAAESHMIGLLRRAGFIVVNLNPETGKQWRVVDHDDRASGRLDGFICDSKLGDPWRLLEIKSANLNQFEELLSVGYEAWKPIYADQIQNYLGLGREQLRGFGSLDEALAVVECKNDSRIYAERIRFNPMRFHELRQKGSLALSGGSLPPARPSAATSQYCGFCKWCPRNEWCWSSTADVRFAS